MTAPPEGLKPCPFCGETPDVNDPATFRATQGDRWGNVTCCCDGPDVRTFYNVKPNAPWHAEAIREWNRRVHAPANGSETPNSSPAPVDEGPREPTYEEMTVAFRDASGITTAYGFFSQGYRAGWKARGKV